jgi:phospho-N-acetylmuramoyl-pentapeptide-transferase
MIVDVPVRPEISLIAILGYAFFAFIIGVLATPWFISFLRRNKLGKQLRVEAVDGREATIFRKYHKDKFGTPTMGGILIWSSILVTVALSRVLSYTGLVEHSLLQRGEVYLPLFTLVSMGLLGAVDDYWNICGLGKKKGLDVLPKISFLILISLIGAWWFGVKLGYDQIHIPFHGDVTVGWWYAPIFLFILVGTANAVNVTDGLDGLAGGLLVIAFLSFAILAFLSGKLVLAAFCAVTVGAIAAFLWHNVPPALFFMGDTGSLALGGMLGVIALMTDNILVLPLVGFVFVIEMLSVIIQLTSKRLRGGKKVFIAAPIHHHFEALDWGESKVTMRLWIIGSFFAFLGILVSIFG